MIAGHFGLAAGVKRWAPWVPLWALLVGTFWLDVLFLIGALLGLESITPLDPARPAYGGFVVHADYTHSLAGAALIALGTGWLASRRWGRAGGRALSAVIFSHWLLDLLVHRPDLPVLPGNLGNLPLLGFGLWAQPELSLLLELALVAGGAFFYYRSAARRSGRAPGRALAAGLAMSLLLILLHAANVLGL